jgi:hypothetical protein
VSGADCGPGASPLLYGGWAGEYVGEGRPRRRQDTATYGVLFCPSARPAGRRVFLAGCTDLIRDRRAIPVRSTSQRLKLQFNLPRGLRGERGGGAGTAAIDDWRDDPCRRPRFGVVFRHRVRRVPGVRVEDRSRALIPFWSHAQAGGRDSEEIRLNAGAREWFAGDLSKDGSRRMAGTLLARPAVTRKDRSRGTP